MVDMILPPIASIIVARSLGPAKLGTFSYVLWLSSIASSLSASGLSAAAWKYMADYAGQRRPDVVRALLRTGYAIQASVVAMVAVLGLVWANLSLPADERVFGSLLMLAIFPTGTMPIASGLNAAVQELRPNVLASMSCALVHTIGLLLTVIMGWGLVGLAAAHLVSRMCDCGIRWALTLTRLPRYLSAMGPDPTPVGERPRLPAGLGREMGRFVVESTILTLLTMVVWSRSEMFFLKRFSSAEQIAFFTVAFTLGLIPGQLVGPFSRAAGVSLYAERGRDAKAGGHVACLYWRYMVLLILPASLGLTALSGPLLRVLYGARYVDAWAALMVAAALGMVGPLANPASSLVTASGGQRRLVAAGLFASAVTLTLDYFLVRSHHAIGAALANGLGQATYLVFVVLIAYRYSFAISMRFFIRVAAAALGMALAVFAVAHFLPDMVSVIVGPVLGVMIFGVFLRVGHVVEDEDVERLLKAETLLPRRCRPYFRKLLWRLVAPAARSETPSSNLRTG